MHLSFQTLLKQNVHGAQVLNEALVFDDLFFYSVPTSFFTVDARVPRILRELISEAEGCLKMNYLTGASACTRKAIYELLVLQKAEGDNYNERISILQAKFPNVDAELFELLKHIKDMTSEKVHEQSWDRWDSAHLKLFLETLKSILYEIYVIPSERSNRTAAIRQLIPQVKAGPTTATE